MKIARFTCGFVVGLFFLRLPLLGQQPYAWQYAIPLSALASLLAFKVVKNEQGTYDQ